MTKRRKKVAVPYQTPLERANQRMQKDLIVEAIVWVILLCSLLMSFLGSGQFSVEVLIGLGIAAAKSLLQAIVSFLQKYLAALGEEGAVEEIAD